MTDPKPPCPRCDGKTLVAGCPYTCPKCGMRFDGVIGKPKPPIPSGAELLKLFFSESDHSDEALSRVWLAGYRARDAELELAQHSAHQRGQTVASQERRIAELEAEVAELRERREAAPRRTPELTERVRAVVRSWLLPSGARDFGPELAVEPLTRDVLDEVFGKKP